MKLPLRTKSVGTKVSEAEFSRLEEQARESGVTLSEWVRERLLAAPVEPSVEPTDEIVLAEVLALRTLFLNLQFRSDKGTLSETEMRGLIERADATKLKRARAHLRGTKPATISKKVEGEARLVGNLFGEE